jgi:hypothetical protein
MMIGWLIDWFDSEVTKLPSAVLEVKYLGRSTLGVIFKIGHADEKND